MISKIPVFVPMAIGQEIDPESVRTTLEQTVPVEIIKVEREETN